MNVGAVILCGGKSTRMGADKASLPFGPETMLQRVVRLMSTVVDASQIAVVAAPDQVVPELPTGIKIARDSRSGHGPMEGLAAGLRILMNSCDAVYVTGCDVPLLAPQFVMSMFRCFQAEGTNKSSPTMIAIPVDENREYPLNAVYRTSVLPTIEQLLARGDFRLRSLLELVPVLRIPTDDLRRVDPSLLSLENINRPEDYRRAVQAAGLPADESLTNQ